MEIESEFGIFILGIVTTYVQEFVWINILDL